MRIQQALPMGTTETTTAATTTDNGDGDRGANTIRRGGMWQCDRCGCWISGGKVICGWCGGREERDRGGRGIRCG